MRKVVFIGIVAAIFLAPGLALAQGLRKARVSVAVYESD